MNPIRLRVPRNDAAALADDLTAWAATSGVNPCLTSSQPSGAPSLDSPVVYLAYVSESFFDQFPHWRMYIEQ